MPVVVAVATTSGLLRLPLSMATGPGLRMGMAVAKAVAVVVEAVLRVWWVLWTAV